ncbi:MAG TPA: tryptophan synthase subunit beta [Candidatus Limnocylindrales bacterium]|nr:tryptophan synthase subunit beta [Candidatus Limnocylindrales bacterium]
MSAVARPPRGARPARAGGARAGILDEIAARREADVARELEGVSPAELRRAAERAGPTRDALGPLLRPGLHLIAELKRRSPSAGRLAADDSDLVARARAYEAGGASAISVLVEPHWFGGSLDDLAAVRRAVALPVLAKEFVVDARQLPLLRAAGADLVLLLAALHPAKRLTSLVAAARELGLEPLVEAHDARELERTLASGARLVGINNRDLRTLAVDPERAVRLRPDVPDDRLVVAESGAREPPTLRAWRAVGFDAALVGEALMAAGDDPAAVRARTAAFVEAGRPPSAAEDPAAADRSPLVKICGVTDAEGLLAAMRAGADAIGLNVVPGTPRFLDLEEAVQLARLVRRAGAAARPQIVAITADHSPEQLAAIVAALDPDVVQLSGGEPIELLARLDRPAWKALHLPREVAPGAVEAEAERIADQARRYLDAGAQRVMLDTAGGPHPGGTGVLAARALAAAVARRVPVILSGGLDPANVARALLEAPALGVDVASGVEAPRAAGERARKDPIRVGLFVKRARGARLDRPHAPARPSPVHPGLDEADARGRWGTERQFGGRFVPETLVAALVELEAAYAALRHDPRFWAELRELGLRYSGRPTPLYRADRLAAELERHVGREPGQLRLYLKREDLAHTGAHKINNALGQALLTHRLGKTRVIAETGAGQHGVATATACALLGLPCVVYMGAEDVKRQAPNVLRMRALGAEVREVSSGSATLKDAINEAMRDWVTNVATTHYVLGSAVGPHPYPIIVRDLQRVIGDEAAAQLAAVEGRLPDAAVACLGGGSNAIGLLSRFVGEPSVRLVGVEAAGEGIATGRHAAALAGGTPGVLHGSRSYLLQDADGQVVEAHSISAGLDYPGIGPQLSALYEAGRLEVLAATDSEALEAVRLVARSEGILPALEPAHAVAALPRLLAGEGGRAPLADDALVLLGLSGRGDKDLAALGG